MTDKGDFLKELGITNDSIVMGSTSVYDSPQSIAGAFKQANAGGGISTSIAITTAVEKAVKVAIEKNLPAILNASKSSAPININVNVNSDGGFGGPRGFGGMPNMPMKGKRVRGMSNKASSSVEGLPLYDAANKQAIDLSEQMQFDFIKREKGTLIKLSESSKEMVKSAKTSAEDLWGIVKHYASKTRQILVGNRAASPEEIKYRQQYVQFTNKYQAVSKLIDSNQSTLKSIEGTSELLKKYNDPKMAKLMEKLKSGEEMTSTEVKKLNTGLESVLTELDKISVELKMDIPQVISLGKNLFMDNKADLDSRRKALSDMMDTLEGQRIDSPALDSIRDMMEEGLNFTKEQNDELKKHMTKVEEETANSNKTVVGNINKFQKEMGGIFASEGEFTNFMSQQTGTMGKIKDWLEKKGLGSMPGQTKKGILSLGLSALGLTGLDDVLGAILGVESVDLLKKAGRGTWSGAKKVGSKVGGLFSGGGLFSSGGIAGDLTPGKSISKTAGKLKRTTLKIGKSGLKTAGTLGRAAVSGGAGLLEGALGLATSMPTLLGGGLKTAGKIGMGGARLLGKLALPLTAAMAGFDAYKGWGNAGEISGKGDKATTADKFKSAGAGALSGLTFGLVSDKTMFKGIESGLNMLFGKGSMFDSFSSFIKGIGTFFAGPAKGIANFFKTGVDKLTEIFGEESVFGSLQAFMEKLYNLPGISWLLGTDKKPAKSDNEAPKKPSKSFFGTSWFSGDDKTSSKPDGQKSSMNSGMSEMKRDLQLDSAAKRAAIANANRPVMNQTAPQQNSGGLVPIKTQSIESPSLAILQADMG